MNETAKVVTEAAADPKVAEAVIEGAKKIKPRGKAAEAALGIGIIAGAAIALEHAIIWGVKTVKKVVGKGKTEEAADQEPKKDNAAEAAAEENDNK